MSTDGNEKMPEMMAAAAEAWSDATTGTGPPKKSKKRLLTSLVIVVIVGSSWYMIGEYNSEKTTLAQYMLQASGEIKNRASIINDYDERERNLDSILALESEIVSIATDFNSTDCAEENSRYAGCSQADYANGLMKELDSRFSAKEVLEQKSRQAVSSRNAIPKPPENLWLLDILGKTTDLNRASSDLDKYSDQIDSRIASINAKIQQYQDAERDCDHPPALTCLNEKPQMEIEER